MINFKLDEQVSDILWLLNSAIDCLEADEIETRFVIDSAKDYITDSLVYVKRLRHELLGIKE